MVAKNEALNRRLAALNPAQLKKLAAKAAAKKNGLPPLGSQARQTPERRIFPMSRAQERIWFLSRLEPESPIYNNPVALKVRVLTSWRVEFFEAALNLLIERQEIFRTTFSLQDEEPVQIIHEAMPLQVDFADLRFLPADERDTTARRRARTAGLQAFDLERGPLLKAEVLRLEDDAYLLLLTPHHIISDGWSNAMFSRQLTAIYAELEAGRKPTTEVSGPQFADYALWEETWLKGDACRHELDFWRRELAELPPAFDLPGDFPRPERISHAGALISRRLDAEVVRRLKDCSRQQQVTLFQLLLTAYKVLLFRYGGAEDLAVGTPVANRRQAAAQKTFGLFLNTLVLRSRPTADKTLGAYLAEVRDFSNRALDHQQLPFEKLVAALNPPRDQARTPFFQAFFVYQNIPALYEISGMQVELLKIDYGLSKFDLNLWVEEIGNELLVSLNYATAIFAPETAAALLATYVRLLEMLPESLAVPLGRLALAAGDLQKPAETLPVPSLPLALWRLWPPTRPTATALADSYGRRLTFAELESSSNAIARRLLAVGAGAEKPVALYCRRSVDLVAGILAVLKSGSPYVPLDPDLPLERLSFMLLDSGAVIILSDDPLAAKKIDSRLQVVGFSDVENADDPGTRRPLPAADQAAYIIYTSGSSGRPKGVCIEQRQLAAYLNGIREVIGEVAGKKLLTLSTPAADLGNTMIFAALCGGGELHIVAPEMLTDARRLSAYINENGIDILKITPSHLEALLAASDENDPPPLPRDLLILGGEALSPALVHEVRRRAPDLRIVNHYGPTETTIGVLTYEIPCGETLPPVIPLGRPLQGSQVIIRDRQLQALPPGFPGEICIGGAQLARGYYRRPELTAAAFVADPMNPGAKLYRTGDRGRLRPDGTIEFLGRLDRQVKVRGFRVELAEIENYLAAYPGITRAAVIQEKGSGRLLAFAETKAEDHPEAAEILADLGQKLPAYMIPAGLSLVSTLPLNRNGKLDYGALERSPPSVSTTSHRRQQPRLPRDQVELELTAIWRELLPNADLDIESNFFAAGGHSLLALRLSAAVRRRFGRDLPLAGFFSHGTIAAQAELLRRGALPVDEKALVQLQSGQSKAPLFFVHPAGGNVLCYYELARALGDDFPFYGLQAINLPLADQASIPVLAQAYLKELLAARPEGPMVLGGWSMGAVIAFEMAARLSRTTKRDIRLVLIDQPAPGSENGDSIGKGSEVAEELKRLLVFVAKLELLLGRSLAVDEKVLMAAPDAAGRSLIIQRALTGAGFLPADTRPEDFHLFLERQKAHNLALSIYRPPQIESPALLLQAEEKLPGASPLVEPVAADAWQALFKTELSCRRIQANHINMMTAPAIALTAAALKEWLAK